MKHSQLNRAGLWTGVITLLLILFISNSPLLAQPRPESGPVVFQSTGPTPPWTVYYAYDANDNLEYICKTKPNQPLYQWDIAGALDATLTNIVVSSNVGTVTTAAAHGLVVGQAVVVSGATVDTDLNGSYVVATVPSTTTFTIATVSVSDATYTDATMVMGSRAPRLNAEIWWIGKFTWGSTGLMQGMMVLVGTAAEDTAGVGNVGNANVAMKLSCAGRAGYVGR
jgi:hypothetical protein